MRNGCAAFAAAALSSAALACVGVASASTPFKQYTLPAAAASRVSKAGTLTLSLPAEWRFSTAWSWGKTSTGFRARSPWASDPVHTSVFFSVGVALERAGTTLDSVRRDQSWAGSHDLWGPGTGVRRMFGDEYVSLPVGKAWRLTVIYIPPTSKGGWAARTFERQYWLDRGLVRTTAGQRKELFSLFVVGCRQDQCEAHNAQFEAVMRSIRLAA